MKNVSVIWRSVKNRPPLDREGLRLWVGVVLGLWMPERGVCADHCSPLDYLSHTFFEYEGDAVVWACRGGGKTMLGAVATLLDMVFKPGVQVRILGGSLEQSDKMYRYLKDMIEGKFSELLREPPTQRRLQLRNGSRVEVLAQSNRSVRGMRVQKLRCDEVELFDPDIWQAAQLTTRSERGVRGTVEVFSTMHRPNGLMQEILEKQEASSKNEEGRKKIFSWCVLDVIENCPPQRPCADCALWPDCGGKAKEAHGFISIDDALAMKQRVSAATWGHEMLCQRPRFDDAVFSSFARERHLREFVCPAIGREVAVDGRTMTLEKIIAGVDFGFAGGFVGVWAGVLREGAHRIVAVLDEMVVRNETVARNAAAMKVRPWNPATVYCDVAGRQRNGQTGVGDETVLRAAGFTVKSSWQRIETGVELLGTLLQPAEGKPRLFISARCAQLIAAFESYRRDPAGRPIKDGVHDHLIDALRYAVCGELAGGKVEMRMY